MPDESDAGGAAAPEHDALTSGAYRALRSEAEIQSWIMQETHKNAGCRGLDVQFVLVATRGAQAGAPTWELRGASGWSAWPPECRRAFLDAVARAQRRFDLQ